MASVTFFRSIAGFGFPLFAPAMFNRLGYGLGSVVLGVATIVIGFPTLVLLRFYRVVTYIPNLGYTFYGRMVNEFGKISVPLIRRRLKKCRTLVADPSVFVVA